MKRLQYLLMGLFFSACAATKVTVQMPPALTAQTAPYARALDHAAIIIEHAALPAQPEPKKADTQLEKGQEKLEQFLTLLKDSLPIISHDYPTDVIVSSSVEQNLARRLEQFGVQAASAADSGKRLKVKIESLQAVFSSELNKPDQLFRGKIGVSVEILGDKNPELFKHKLESNFSISGPKALSDREIFARNAEFLGHQLAKRICEALFGLAQSKTRPLAQSPDPLIQKGLRAAGQENWKKAVELWRQSAAEHPSAAAYQNLGAALEQLELYKEALQYYDQALKLAPNADVQKASDEIRAFLTSLPQ